MGDGLLDRMNAAELSTAYVDDFLDSVEHLPDDIQREISCIRELDIRYQNLLSEIESLQTQYNADPDSFVCPKVMCQIQMKLIYLQELGDEKLQKGQQILDILESNQRQLDIGCKHLEMEQQDDSQDNSKEAAPERASKRARRTRTDNTSLHNENSSDAASLPCAERPVLRTPGSRTCAQKKVTKKKKRKSRNVERDRDDSPTEIPIDPNEPTYCLCEQVSYGEMIGCDNDLCPIEWFHFSCVSLTNKPKGKWFCPKCRGDKATVMKPRAQFLKELQKYNKEREERS